MPTAGLTDAQAATRLRCDGRNEVDQPVPTRLGPRVGRALIDPLIVLLLAAAVVTMVAGDLPDTLVIILVVVVNTAIGVAQEVRADRAVAALRRLGAPSARVVRDGQDRVVPAAEVVCGDVVLLAGGDVVPADVRLHEAYRLRVDESALTGESVPVHRGAGEELSAGTVVALGRARGEVVRTGAASALGQIAALVSTVRPGPTPLQQRLARLGRVLGIWVVVLSAVVAVVGIAGGRPALEMAIVGVSLVVAAVPESLPAVVTLGLALGARRMANAHAIARRLPAVETLGSVTVLASDKTGTLTQGRMAVQEVVTAGGLRLRVVGTGYAPTGRVLDAAGVLAAPPNELATACALCNDASLLAPQDGVEVWTVAGDPIEGALLAFAGRCGLTIDEIRRRHPRVAEQPFDAATRRMVTEHRDPDGSTLVVAKGAPEVILAAGGSSAASSADRAAVRIDAAAREALLLGAHDLAGAGLRVLAVAAGPPGALLPLGLVGIGDPVRANARSVLEQLAGAGVRTVLVTGDHLATASAIAAQLGLWRPGDTAVACDSANWRDGDPAQVRIYARAHPQQKLEIITALQEHGDVVAVTGDGVNDAPALRRADIGVAMGGGTEVARQAADLVLADDNLATVAAAVAAGRRVYDNIRRFLRYALSGGVAELLVMLTGPLVGFAVPLLPAQILWVNLLTHGLPGVAMGAEPGSPQSMSRPPRARDESVLGAGLGSMVLVLGTAIAVCVLAAARWAGGAPWQTVAFLVLGFAQLWIALAVRAPRRAGQPGNPWLYAAVGLSAALMVAGVGLAPLRDLLGTHAVPLSTVLATIVVAALPGAGLSLWTARRHRSDQVKPADQLPA